MNQCQNLPQELVCAEFENVSEMFCKNLHKHSPSLLFINAVIPHQLEAIGPLTIYLFYRVNSLKQVCLFLETFLFCFKEQHKYCANINYKIVLPSTLIFKYISKVCSGWIVLIVIILSLKQPIIPVSSSIWQAARMKVLRRVTFPYILLISDWKARIM